jgi:uncharacterized protein with HEPN domain
MQPEIRDAGYLWDMLDAAETIRKFTDNVKYHEYIADRKLQLAVERCVEVIGEAAGRISQTFREAHPEIHWRLIIAQRNVIAHEYGEIKTERMYALVNEHIPELIEKLQKLAMPPIQGDEG